MQLKWLALAWHTTLAAEVLVCLTMQRLTVSRSKIAPIARAIPATMTIHVLLPKQVTSIHDALAENAGAAGDQKKHKPWHTLLFCRCALTVKALTEAYLSFDRLRGV